MKHSSYRVAGRPLRGRGGLRRFQQRNGRNGFAGSFLNRTAAGKGGYVEKVYQFDKVGGFIGAGTPESRAFTAARLAAGSSMLRDMFYTAWIDSAQPVPDPYADK